MAKNNNKKSRKQKQQQQQHLSPKRSSSSSCCCCCRGCRSKNKRPQSAVGQNKTVQVERRGLKCTWRLLWMDGWMGWERKPLFRQKVNNICGFHARIRRTAIADPISPAQWQWQWPWLEPRTDWRHVCAQLHEGGLGLSKKKSKAKRK